MSAGNVAAGEDHDHEGGADGEWRDDPGRAGNDGATDREDEEEGTDEFCDVFFHEVWCLVFSLGSGRVAGAPGSCYLALM